jgi:AcrR family transcriptional regulator
MNQSPTTEEKIISAAIVCIDKYGIQGATNRKIAQEAGVNNAAINYYFRSKDALIQRCLEVTLHNAFDFEDFEALPGDTPQEWCAAIINDLIVGGLNYPGLARFHFYEVLANGKYDSLAVEKLNEFVGNLVRNLLSRKLDMDEVQLQYACMQMTSVMMMSILAPRLFEQQFGLNVADEAMCKAYVDALVSKILA